MSIFDLGAHSPTLPSSDEYWIAPSASVIGRVTLKNNASVWFGAVLRGDTEDLVLGQDSNVQDGSVVHADPGYPVRVGDGVTIGHGVIVHGATIGANSLIGMGSVILNGAQIGRNCLIGARSLITENKVIPDGSVVMGAPGRIMRQTTAEEVAAHAESARRYVENWKRYARELGAAR
jgi:carbonic anhydrase/acetyltransferase-like protein (isoleucine patch superfamily)